MKDGDGRGRSWRGTGGMDGWMGGGEDEMRGKMCLREESSLTGP